MRLEGVAMAFFAVSILLFAYVGWGSCVNFLQSWLGAPGLAPFSLDVQSANWDWC